MISGVYCFVIDATSKTLYRPGMMASEVTLNTSPEYALLIIALFSVKHIIADFFLQFGWMLSGRAAYLHMGRLTHASIHALGTAIVLAICKR